MSRFPTGAHPGSWALICPGNRESAGKQTSGRICPDSPWLRRTLGEAARAASRTRKSNFGALYGDLVRSRLEKLGHRITLQIIA